MQRATDAHPSSQFRTVRSILPTMHASNSMEFDASTRCLVVALPPRPPGTADINQAHHVCSHDVHNQRWHADIQKPKYCGSSQCGSAYSPLWYSSISSTTFNCTLTRSRYRTLSSRGTHSPPPLGREPRHFPHESYSTSFNRTNCTLPPQQPSYRRSRTIQGRRGSLLLRSTRCPSPVLRYNSCRGCLQRRVPFVHA